MIGASRSIKCGKADTARKTGAFGRNIHSVFFIVPFERGLHFGLKPGSKPWPLLDRLTPLVAPQLMSDIGSFLENACARQDVAQHRQNYLAQDEFVVVENFLPAEVLAQWDWQLEQLKPHIHRN